MGDNTSIEWTDSTWNPTVGCSLASPGCTNCYAMREAHRMATKLGIGKYSGLTMLAANGKPVWTGELRVHWDAVDQPLRWRRPRRIFVDSMSDLFHDGVPDEAIDKVFAVMALCPRHTFQVLTKRSARMRAWFAERWQGTPAQRYKVGNEVFDVPAGGETGRRGQVEDACEGILERFPKMVDTDNDALWDEQGRLKIRTFSWPLPNVWLGVSAEDQVRADERVPDLLATPAAVRFVSAEPLLGPIDLNRLPREPSDADRAMPGFAGVGKFVSSALEGEHGLIMADDGREYWGGPRGPRLDWVIAGGESGSGARPAHPDWIRSLRDQCQAAGVAFHLKQWGEWADHDQPGVDMLGSASSPLHDWGDGHTSVRIGKSASGATLDGREWRDFPTARSAP